MIEVIRKIEGEHVLLISNDRNLNLLAQAKHNSNKMIEAYRPSEIELYKLDEGSRGLGMLGWSLISGTAASVGIGVFRAVMKDK